MNELPEPVNTQFVARILSNQSGSSFEIEIPDDEVTFSVEGNPRSEYGLTIGVARMPAKFRNLIFVKKGSLVIVDVVSHNFIGNGAQSKNKITHDIEAILSPEQIRNLAKKDFLPECFSSEALRKVTESANAATTEDGFLKTKNYVDDEDEDDEFSLGSRNVRIGRFALKCTQVHAFRVVLVGWLYLPTNTFFFSVFVFKICSYHRLIVA